MQCEKSALYIATTPQFRNVLNSVSQPIAIVSTTHIKAVRQVAPANVSQSATQLKRPSKQQTAVILNKIMLSEL